MPERTLSQRTNDIQSQVVMLKQSASAIYRGDMAKDVSSIWFDGACIILKQVENLMCDILDIGDARLDSLEKKKASGEPQPGA